MSDDRIATKTTTLTSAHNPRLATALAFRARGWSVFPVAPHDKAPLTRYLPARDPSKPRHAKNNPPTFLPFVEQHASEEQLQTWWEKQPQANIGLLAQASGLLVVDVDAHKATAEELAALQGYLPPTPYVVETPSGGRHYYYAALPAPLRAVTQKAHRFGGFVDVQSGNLYVVAPPSNLVHGAYRWQGGAVLPTDPLPAAPSWTIADECDKGSPRVFTGDWLTQAWATTVPENGDPSKGLPGRKQHVRSMALSEARLGVTLAVATARLQAWNELRCRPPLRQAEVAKLTSVMYEHHYNDMGLGEDDGITLRVQAPAFPVDVLRVAEPLWSWASYTSGIAQIHQDLVCFSAIMAVSVAATGRYRIEIEGIPRQTWAPPVLAWGVVVAPSGSKKSAVMRSIEGALAPTQELLAQFALRFNAELKACKEVLGAAKTEARKALNHSDPSRRQMASSIISRVSLEIESLPEELPPVWMLGDTTPEAMSMIMSQLHYLALVSEEGDDVLGGFFGRYGNGSANFSGLLKAYDLGSTTSARVGRGINEVRDATASMFLMTQPTGLSGLTSHEATDRGLIARILWCIPKMNTAEYLDPPSLDTADRARADKVFGAMLRAVYCGGRGKFDELKNAAQSYKPEYETTTALDLSEFEEPDAKPKKGRPPKALVMPESRKLLPPKLRETLWLRISVEAQAPAHELHAHLKHESRLGGDHHLAASWANKGREHAFRIAALLALADSWGDAREIEIKFVEAACELVRDYFLPQVAAAADLMTWPAEAGKCMHLLHRFAGRDTFTVGDVARELRIATTAASHLVEWLADRGALTATKKGRTITCKLLPNVSY